MVKMSDTNNNIKEIKKITKRLAITVYANIALGTLLILLFVTSFMEFSPFKDLHILLKLIWLPLAILNFYGASRSFSLINKSKNFISVIEELHSVEKW